MGGGNHFIELQEDEAGILCIMIHSGSRNFGYKVANYYNNQAKELNAKRSSPVPREYDLAYLPIDSEIAGEYISWMTLALEFARENRDVMLDVVKRNLLKVIPSMEFKNEVNAHHNYAAEEHHYGKRYGFIESGRYKGQRRGNRHYPRCDGQLFIYSKRQRQSGKL